MGRLFVAVDQSSIVQPQQLNSEIISVAKMITYRCIWSIENKPTIAWNSLLLLVALSAVAAVESVHLPPVSYKGYSNCHDPQTFNGQTMDYAVHTITNLWNGDPDPSGKSVTIKMAEAKNEMVITIEAPFYNDPKPPNGKPGEAYFKLWDYEVVEAFFLASASQQYLELEFGPHGQHLVLLLNGTRNAIKHSLDLDYKASIDGQVWKGVANIPKSYFPDNFDKWNAYAISGTGENRVYKSLFPVPGEAPDFHRLNDFKDIVGFECLKVPAEEGSDEAKAKNAIWSVATDRKDKES